MMPAQQCIDLITIDAFTESTGLKVDFIKIDVEGYELNCIRGAVNTIKDNRPAIFCEAINKNITNEVVSFLSDLGYEGFGSLETDIDKITFLHVLDKSIIN